MMDIFFAPGRKIVEYPDRVAAVQQLVDDVRSDKPGTPGYQVGRHVFLPFFGGSLSNPTPTITAASCTLQFENLV
jgi:hypothetical protein